MRKQSKLYEKSARISDTRLASLDNIIHQYLSDIESMNKEQARSHRFSMLLQALFGIEPGFIESYCSGIERSLKSTQKDRVLRGEADNLFGNVIIEFESNIIKKRTEAEKQLCHYVAILWSQESLDKRTPYLCIATDGIRFFTYSPKLSMHNLKEIAPDDISLNLLEDTDWTKLKSDEIFFWLDRYLLRKEILHPKSEDIVHDFGSKSHAFETITNSLLSLWEEIKAHSEYAVIYDSWAKYLSIVYGSKIASDTLFMSHTYLATLAKLMSWIRISESISLPEEKQIAKMLEGSLFKDQGIENFIEEDFFSWLARPEAIKTGIDIVHRLFSLLKNYNLRELSEDVLKSLYQELVDPQTRHDLGEFYTPDWLAHRIVKKLLSINEHGLVLDPACGSGTFLYLTIKEKRALLDDSVNTLYDILNAVQGLDVHPLAVIIAKTNYILALGDLLKRRKSSIAIPVYLSNTIRLPEKEVEPTIWRDLPSYKVELGGNEILLPKVLLKSVGLYDQAIELIKEFAQQYKGKDIALEQFQSFLIAQHFSESGNSSLVQSLLEIAKVLKSFIDANRDTIWAFVLKNSYKPLFLKKKFDFIVGNPPWIAFRYMEPDYQDYLRGKIVNEYKLLSGRGELITHLEIATLFLLRASDLYLKADGKIAFVLPRSLFSADQHDSLRKGSFRFSEDSEKNLSLSEIWDCENVTPLFNVPACVIIADKIDILAAKNKEAQPVSGQILSGKLARKNESYEKAEEALSIENITYYLHKAGKHSFWTKEKLAQSKESSYYKDHFYQGATIVPRSLWFVQIKQSPLGFNPDLPPLETADRAVKEAKAAYKSIFFKDTVESKFLYATLLSTDLVPFGHLSPRLVVLPIEPEDDHYKLINAEEAQKRGYFHLAGWLKKAEEEWIKRRSEKAEQSSLIKWLDYRNKLTRQNPQTKYRIVYPTSATYLCSAVVENKPITISVEGQSIFANRILLDYKLYYMETDNCKEAHYLSSFLNSHKIDELIKPMQSRGLWGPRDICKKIFEIPICKFESSNAIHLQLSKMGEDCSTKIKQWMEQGNIAKIKSIGRLRSMVRETLKDELKEIDEIVKQILK